LFAGTPDEVETIGVLLLGPDGSFITGTGGHLIGAGLVQFSWRDGIKPGRVKRLNRTAKS
jgi:hypothetical protein